MMRCFLMACIICGPLLLAAQEDIFSEADHTKIDSTIYSVVEHMPEYPGGTDSLHGFIERHFHYPSSALRYGLEGTVFVGFVIEKNGSISQVKFMKGLGAEIDKEAMRVVAMLQRWSAGKQDGKLVRVQFAMPLRVRLPEDKRKRRK